MHRGVPDLTDFSECISPIFLMFCYSASAPPPPTPPLRRICLPSTTFTGTRASKPVSTAPGHRSGVSDQAAARRVLWNFSFNISEIGRSRQCSSSARAIRARDGAERRHQLANSQGHCQCAIADSGGRVVVCWPQSVVAVRPSAVVRRLS